jgi:predicted TPR repeat methyltransferase
MKLKPNAIRRTLGSAQGLAPGTPDLPTALAQAIGLLRAERLPEADAALAAVLQRWPEQSDALHYQGVLRHTQGRTEEGVALIRRALQGAPNDAGAWSNLGNVLLLAGRFDDAAAAYESAIQSAKHSAKQSAKQGAQQATGEPPSQAASAWAPALNNLCTLHRHRGQLARSESAAREALEQVPDFADAWYNLSLTLMAQGRINESLKADSQARALWPADKQQRHELIRALLLLGENGRAAGLVREWLAQEPNNPIAFHMLAACEAGMGSGAVQANRPNAKSGSGPGPGPAPSAPARASDDYVKQVFDAFSTSFDAKLEALNYRAPEWVMRSFAAAVGKPRAALDIVDAGCGTGLCGPLLRPYAKHLAGCDLSEGMLRRAKVRGGYDVLHAAELTFYLDTQPGAFDAVISADTLCYFGALEAPLAAAQRCLRPGGWIVFSVEAMPQDAGLSHRLLSSGRYAHAFPYLNQALAAVGFESITLEPVDLRMEAGEPVRGFVARARKA